MTPGRDQSRLRRVGLEPVSRPANADRRLARGAMHDGEFEVASTAASHSLSEERRRSLRTRRLHSFKPLDPPERYSLHRLPPLWYPFQMAAARGFEEEGTQPTGPTNSGGGSHHGARKGVAA